MFTYQGNEWKGRTERPSVSFELLKLKDVMTPLNCREYTDPSVVVEVELQ